MTTTEDGVLSYKADTSQSKFTVQAFATGLLSGFGHNPTIAIRDFTAEIRFVPETFANAAFRLEVRADSLTVIDDVKEKDRLEIEETMHRQVLETATYPDIVFQSTSVTVTRVVPGRYKARIIGDLTLHGVTRAGLWLQAQLMISEDQLRAQGDFILKQSDFKIKPVSVAAGALKLKDELKFNFDIVTRRESS